MKKILITGSAGIIGTVLRQGLKHEVTDFDLPESDTRDYAQVVRAMDGHDAVMHLAWDTQTDNFRSEHLNHENALQIFNIYKAALEVGVKRIVVASSVHADKFNAWGGKDLMDPYRLPVPDSPYGAGKCLMEALGRYYSDAKGLSIICIRFGGVNPEDVAPTSPRSEAQVWLSHRDCVNLVTSCLDAQLVPNNYAIVYGVSDNEGRLHDISNPFGWKPQDGAK